MKQQSTCSHKVKPAEKRRSCGVWHNTLLPCKHVCSVYLPWTPTATTSCMTSAAATTSAGDFVDIMSARSKNRRFSLGRMLLIDHIAEEGQWLVVGDCHWSSREFYLRLSLGWRQEVRFNFIHKHPNLHRIGMNNALFSLDVCVKSSSETLLELGPPHLRWHFACIEKSNSLASWISIAWIPLASWISIAWNPSLTRANPWIFASAVSLPATKWSKNVCTWTVSIAYEFPSRSGKAT